jgi:hypothetical protein
MGKPVQGVIQENGDPVQKRFRFNKARDSIINKASVYSNWKMVHAE